MVGVRKLAKFAQRRVSRKIPLSQTLLAKYFDEKL
jgi:hypothetical protein